MRKLTTRVRVETLLVEGCEWIARNDSPGDDDAPEHIAGYPSVHLLATLCGLKETVRVADIIWRIRNPGKRPPS